MKWMIHTRLRSQARTFVLAGKSLQQVESAAHPDLLPRQESLLGRAGDLVFYQTGSSPSFDLEIVRGEQSLRLINVQMTRKLFAWLPALDAIAILSGDLGTSVSRRVRLFALAPIREALDAGHTQFDADDLDSTSIIGVQLGVELDQDGLLLVPVSNSPELLLAWNVPRADPAEANVVAVRFPYAEGVRLSMARPESSSVFKIERFWMISAHAGLREDGTRRLSMIGVIRRGTNFHLAVRVLDSAATNLATALREGTPQEQSFLDVHLRNAGALERALAFPDHAGYVFTIETPMRKRQLMRLELSGDKFEVQQLEVEPVPVLLAIEPEPMEALSPQRSELVAPAASAMVVASNPVPPVSPGPAQLGVPTSGSVAVPENTSMAVRERTMVLLEAPGCSVSLGHHPADAAIWPKVYVIGDGSWADLRWWVSQSSGDGALVAYTLHLQCSRSLLIRVVL
ncbi:MAG: hypothetical protein RBU37_01065 [Myxococcota bacterium]|nr:hypothetical protein [Myxococcota bacterium]